MLERPSVNAILAWYGQTRMHSPQSMQSVFVMFAFPCCTLIASVGHFLIQFVHPLHLSISRRTEWKYFHSVRLDMDKCKGCTNCIKKCPTEAIRVQHGKANITNTLCIDCGECIRVCPYHAKIAFTDGLSSIQAFKYKIALPAPAPVSYTHLDVYKRQIHLQATITTIWKK